jgi:hypothetical protein
MQQLVRCPQPFSREWLLGEVVNQTDEIQLVGHRRQLAADGLRRENESPIEHTILLQGAAHRRQAIAHQCVRILSVVVVNRG